MRVGIENITASFDLGQRLELQRCADKLAGSVRYNPKSFPGMFYRERNGRAIIILFSSGKAVYAGANSEDALRGNVTRFAEKLFEKKILAILPNDFHIRIYSITATIELDEKLDLEALASVLENINFENDSYLVHEIPSLGVKFLIFEPGKILCVGKKSELETRKAIKQLLDVVEKVRSLVST